MGTLPTASGKLISMFANQYLVLLLKHKQAEDLIRILRKNYPSLPPATYWSEEGKSKIYFNHKIDELSFFIDFSGKRIYIGNYNSKYWKKRLPFENFKEFRQSIRKILDKIEIEKG